MPPAPLRWLPVTSLSNTHAAITYRSNLLGVRLGHGRTPGDIYKTSDPIDLFSHILNTMLDAVRPYVGKQQPWQSRESLITYGSHQCECTGNYSSHTCQRSALNNPNLTIHFATIPCYQVTTRKAFTVPEIRRDSRGTTHEALGWNTSSVPFSLIL